MQGYWLGECEQCHVTAVGEYGRAAFKSFSQCICMFNTCEHICRFCYFLIELTFVSLTEQEKWFFVGAVLVRVTVAVMKLQDQKQLGEERACFSHSSM